MSSRFAFALWLPGSGSRSGSGSGASAGGNGGGTTVSLGNAQIESMQHLKTRLLGESSTRGSSGSSGSRWSVTIQQLANVQAEQDAFRIQEDSRSMASKGKPASSTPPLYTVVQPEEARFFVLFASAATATSTAATSTATTSTATSTLKGNSRKGTNAPNLRDYQVLEAGLQMEALMQSRMKHLQSRQRVLVEGFQVEWKQANVHVQCGNVLLGGASYRATLVKLQVLEEAQPDAFFQQLCRRLFPRDASIVLQCESELLPQKESTQVAMDVDVDVMHAESNADARHCAKLLATFFKEQGIL